MTQQDKNQANQNAQTDGILDLENELQGEIDEATKAEEEIETDLEHGQIYQAEEELQKLKESLARAQADYANLLRRVDRDRADMTSFITGNIITKLLPTVDNLSRATASVPAEIVENSWVKGIEATYSGFIKQLESFGMKSFDSVGQEVDTAYHEVMSQAPGKENTVIVEFEKGYTLNDRVIRHAKVVVGNGTE